MTPDQPSDSDDADGERTRKQGVEFGPLDAELEAHNYPTTTAELIEAYGDRELGLPDGSQTLGSILRVLSEDDEEFDSPSAVRETVYLAAGSDAVGREGYSDRGGTVSADEQTL